MSKHILYSCLATTLLACASCTDTLLSEQPVPQGEEQVLIGEDAIPGVLNIEVTEELADRLEAMADQPATRAAAVFTRAADAIGTERLEQVFHIGGRFEARQRKAGLHLCYRIRFDKTVPVAEAAAQLKKEDGIRMVEAVYPRKQEEEATWPQSLPIQPAPATRATKNLPFNDPLLYQQWALHNDGTVVDYTGKVLKDFEPGADVNAFEAWKITTGTPNVIVAVLDHGVYWKHEDLIDAMWVNEAELNGQPGVDDDGNSYVDDVYGYNFAEDKPDVESDSNDHGTHCAGIIGARANNGKGIAGIAGGNGQPGTGVRIMSCQNIGDEWSDSGKSFEYAADMGAVIASCSWMDPFDPYERLSAFTKRAVDYFIQYAGCDENGNQRPDSPMKGGIVIAAAGNDGWITTEPKAYLKHYPAGYDPVVAVSSFGPKRKRAWYSCFGDWIDICAPGGDAMYQGSGGDILSTVKPTKDNGNTAYMTKWGTSQATPYVSGIAALIVSAKGGPGFTNEDCKHRLLTALRPFDIDADNPEFAGKLGAGYIDAALALADNKQKAPEKTALTVVGTTDRVTLTWNICKDEDDGTAAFYRIYYSKEAFTVADFSKARNVHDADISYVDVRAVGKPAGEEMKHVVTQLTSNVTWHFAIVPTDRWGLTAEPAFAETTTTNQLPYIENMPADTVKVSNLKPTVLTLHVVEPEGHRWICEIEGDDNGYSLKRDSTTLRLIIRAVRPLGKHTVGLHFRDELGGEETIEIPYTIVPAGDETESGLSTTFTIRTVDVPKGILLQPYFSLAQGQQMTYTCEVMETGIVKAEVFTDMLKVTPLGAGQTRVRVTARDERNNRQVQDFLIRVTEAATAEEPFVYGTYPSLLHDRLYIQLSEKSRGAKAIIRTTSGREVMRTDLQPNDELVAPVEVSHLAPGVYKLEVVSPAGTYKQTIMKGA